MTTRFRVTLTITRGEVYTFDTDLGVSRKVSIFDVGQILLRSGELPNVLKSMKCGMPETLSLIRDLNDERCTLTSQPYQMLIRDADVSVIFGEMLVEEL